MPFTIEIGGQPFIETIMGWIAQGPFVFALNIFINGGWIFVVFLVIYGGYLGWLDNRQGKFIQSWNRIFLAIDVPKLNEQTPKAVEQMLAHLAGAYKTPIKKEVHWDGFVQPWFTLELISIEGYIQYIISAPERYRDLVEAAVYSQYPDAEITQVEDYTKGFEIKTFFQTHDLWGTELVLKNDQAYPLRTYPQFEHVLSGEFLDPLGPLMEIMGRMSRGEQLWLQICVKPINDGWAEKSEALVRKLIGAKKSGGGSGIFGGIINEFQGIFQEMLNQINIRPGETAKKEKSDIPSLMQHLSPGEKSAVESIQLKASKTGFESKIRMMYLAHKEVMNKAKGVEGFMGAMRPFEALGSNGFKVGKSTKTAANYILTKQRIRTRQIKLLRAYKSRSMWLGGGFFVLNIEELATLYHFPTISVKAPLLKRTEAKRAEPPFGIPITDIEEIPTKVTAKPPEAKETPPSEIPIVD